MAAKKDRIAKIKKAADKKAASKKAAKGKKTKVATNNDATNNDANAPETPADDAQGDAQGATSDDDAKKGDADSASDAPEVETFSVSDIARGLDLEPKVARARLRAVDFKGKHGIEGRYPKAAKDTDLYNELVKIIGTAPAKKAKKDDGPTDPRYGNQNIDDE